jgi:hypothetical protein
MTVPAKLVEVAAEIFDTNPAGSQLIVNLGNAETGAELIKALNDYDFSMSETEDMQEMVSA